MDVDIANKTVKEFTEEMVAVGEASSQEKGPSLGPADAVNVSFQQTNSTMQGLTKDQDPQPIIDETLDTFVTTDSAVKSAYDMFDRSNARNTSSANKVASRIITTRARIQDQSAVIGEPIFENDIVDYDQASFNSHPRPHSSPIRKSTQAKPSVWIQLVTHKQFASNLTMLVQIILNSIVFFLTLAVTGLAIYGIKRDVDIKMSQNVNKLIYEINSCKKDYYRHNCVPEMRVPALESQCMQWHDCMLQDPQSVLTSAAYFEVIADCLNALFQNLTWKTMFGVIMVFFLCVVLPNLIFSKMRVSQSQSAGATSATTTNTTNNSHTTINKNYLPSNEKPLINHMVKFDPNVSYSIYDEDST